MQKLILFASLVALASSKSLSEPETTEGTCIVEMVDQNSLLFSLHEKKIIFTA